MNDTNRLGSIFAGAIYTFQSEEVADLAGESLRLTQRAFPGRSDIRAVVNDEGPDRFDRRIQWARNHLLRNRNVFELCVSLVEAAGIHSGEFAIAPPVLRAVLPVTATDGPSMPESGNLHRDTWWGSSYAQVNWWPK
jgi:hypothetical protein